MPGEKRALRALIDNGAQLNLISQKAVRDLDLEGSDVPRPVAKYLNDQRLQLHRAHDLELSVADIAGTHRKGSQRFWGADIMGYDLILGWDWLKAFDPLISFRTGSFVWNKRRREEEGTLSREKIDWFIAAIEDGSVGIVMNDGRVLGKTCQPGESPPSYAESELGKSIRIPWDSYASYTNWDKDPTTAPPADEKPWYVGAIAQYESMSKTTKSAKSSPADLPKAY
jgi:hypothetical protein